MKIHISILFLLSILVSSINAQTFGFGCLGLSGFHGGYGVSFYNADGLNEELDLLYQNSSGSDDLKFERASGFRFGANLLRANFRKVFFTAKGFYQFSRETHDYVYSSQTDTKDELALTTNHWGIGIDFGIPIFEALDWKLLEGGVKFYKVEFENKNVQGNEEIDSEKYKSDGTDIGYYVGTGLIVNLIRGYVSLEGTAMYNFFEIDKIYSENDTEFPSSSIDNPLIGNGGFAAAIQLNVGFPL